MPKSSGGEKIPGGINAKTSGGRIFQGEFIPGGENAKASRGEKMPGGRLFQGGIDVSAKHSAVQNYSQSRQFIQLGIKYRNI